MARIFNDRIEDLYCQCTKQDIAVFKIYQDKIKCNWCGREIKCTPPVEFVIKGNCPHCEEFSTFIIDSLGIKICTRCGRPK